MTATQDRCDTTGKICYASRERAFIVARWTNRSNKMRAKTAAKRVPCHAYRCEHCQSFHVGHISWEKGATGTLPRVKRR